ELEQERLSFAEAIRLEEQMNEEQRAQTARAEEIARQWVEEERKRAMVEAKSTKKIDWNDPSVIRYHTLKMKPKTVAQARSNMIKYLKNRGNYKISDFKGMYYDEIRPIFEKVWDFNQHIKPIKHETEKTKSPEESPKKIKSPEKIVEENVDIQEEMKEVVKEPGAKRKKSIPRKSTKKRQKMGEDAEKEELKGFLDIIPREEVPIEVESISTKFPIVDWKTCVLTENFIYYQVFIGDGSSKNYKVLSEMLEDFDRQDVEELYRLVKERYSTSRPEGFDLMLWGDLHTLFEPDEDDEIWKDQHEYNLEAKYPLSQEMLTKMLSRKLEVDHESSQAFELLSNYGVLDEVMLKGTPFWSINEEFEKVYYSDSQYTVGSILDRNGKGCEYKYGGQRSYKRITTHSYLIMLFTQIDVDTGERVGRGGRGRRHREGNDERVEDLNGQGNDQVLGANEGVKVVNGNVMGANGGSPDFSTIIAKLFQNLLPAMLAQVSNRGNVGNQNGNVVNENVQENVRNVIVNGNWVGCSYKEFLAYNPKEYNGKGGALVLTRWIEKMENVQDMSSCSNDQKVKYIAGSFVGKALMWWNSQIRTLSREVAISGALTDAAVRNGSIKKIEKRGNVGEPSKDRSGRDDNKRTRTGNAFAAIVNPIGRENTGTWPKCTICNSYHAPGGLCRICFNCNRPGHLTKDYRGVPRNVNPVNARNPTVRACYECGSSDHVMSACLRLNRAQGP
ncbi:hypothetical protein Tco_0901246, partial [Tanacetum coccineum]